MEKIHVIYVAGVGRSGSTIVDRVLGTLDNVSSFNEIYRLFLEGVIENNLCACNAHFNDCDFWKKIMTEVVDSPEHAKHIMELHESIDHSRHFLRLYFKRYNREFGKDLEEYREWLRKLYFNLAEQSGNNIIVDSSKVPTRALILNDIPGIEVHVVHLVRDVRAVVNAWQKQKHNPAAGHSLPIYSPYRTIAFWCTRNILSELLGRRMSYHRVLYEDFGLKPQQTLQGLVDSIEPLKGQQLNFLPDGSIKLHSLHTIGGNPDRFTSGATHLRLDTKWIESLAAKTKRLAAIIASPLLLRYGYFGDHSPKSLLSKKKS